jgi:hypothetical protein
MHRNPSRASLASATVLSLAAALTIITAPAASGDDGPDLSSRAGIESYLISIGVDPAEAVWQESGRNYAGPSCPGIGWDCAPASVPIVQLAAPLGTNLFECSGPNCIAIQVALGAGQNDADCERGDKHEDVAVQTCLITQMNTTGNNNAVINQSIEQKGADVTARQVGRIEQMNGSGKNLAGFHQVITQSSQVRGTEQSQEAHQAATLDQDTTTGSNTSNIDQRQNQTQRASDSASIEQFQNTMVGTDVTCDRPEDVTFDQMKNQCAEVMQDSSLTSGGVIRSDLQQTIEESQSASNSPSADQQQGNACHCLGQQGDVDQHSSAPVHSEDIQETRQSQTAAGVPEAGLTQFKDVGDPRCCQVQGINPNSTAHITQKTDQMASSPNAIQEAILVGDCVTTGTCTVFQSATVNGETTTNDDCTDQSFCSEVLVCESVGEGEGTVCSEPELT